jgi:hypothetical protein
MEETSTPSTPSTPAVETPAVQAPPADPMNGLWPELPTDESFVNALLTDATLKIDETAMLAGLRAAFAEKVGLFDLPEKMVEQMESTAERLEEPCGKDWYELRKLITEKKYGDVLGALGVSGTFISEAKKKTFLNRANSLLIGPLVAFHNQLEAFRQNVLQGGIMSNPLAAIALISGKAMPGYASAAIQTPSSDPLRDSALGLRQQINKVFAGHGLICARALAYDAMRIKAVLENPQLPMYLGHLNKDQMLKSLGAGVTADYARLERDVAQYAVAAIRLPDIPRGEVEQAFIGNLFQLDFSIGWDRLNISTSPRRF